MGTSHKQCSHINFKCSFLGIFFAQTYNERKEAAKNMQKQTDMDKDLVVL